MTVNRLGVRKGMSRKCELAARQIGLNMNTGLAVTRMKDEERRQRVLKGIREGAEHLRALAPAVGVVVFNRATESAHVISRVIPQSKGPPVIYLEGVKGSVSPYILTRT